MALLLAAAAAVLLQTGPSFAVERTVVDSRRSLTAEIVTTQDGRSTRLDVYWLARGKRLLVYTHPAVGERQEFDETIPARGGFPDFFADGTPSLVYRSFAPASMGSTLYVLRYARPYFKQAGVFPNGRIEDLGGDGGREVVTERHPLGRLGQIRCGKFWASTSQAVAADVLAWRDGRFVSVAADHSAFWRARIARHEQALRDAEAGGLPRVGEALGLALSLYYDEAASGRADAGWRRLSDAIGRAAASSLECAEKIRGQLREELYGVSR